MGFMDMFIERDEKKVKEKPAVQQPARPAEMITITSSPIVTGTANPSLVQDFLDKFHKVLADENTRNFPGNDYFEYIQMKEAMTAAIPEDIKYQTAYAGWRAIGQQTKDILISTAKKYLSIVERDIADVEAALKSQYDQTVGKTVSLIAQKSAEAKKLADQIAQLNAEIQELKKSNVDQEGDIVSQRDAFTIASKQIREEILTEIDKITKYIPQ